VSSAESPYLAFIVGLHVATAIALLIYFWRDWIRIIGGFFSSIRDRKVRTEDQKLAWMIILATIPVGVVGLLFEHAFRVIFAKPIIAGIFLAVNGVILIAGERYRSRASRAADAAIAAERDPRLIPAREPELVAAGRAPAGSHARDGARALRQQEQAEAIQADRRLAQMGYPQAVVVGSAQILALLAGISRDGVTMVAGMARGLSREDAARFAFLLATPVILAAGALKIPDLLGPLGNGIRGQILLGSVLSGVGAYLSVRFLLRYLRTRTLTPFGVYCLIAGVASVLYLGLVK
jgi:undecaprenyl-diphosphatase